MKFSKAKILINVNIHIGLDVTTPEPLPTNHELFRLPNCFISPHICSAEMSTRLKMANITAMNIVNALSSSNNQLIHELSL
jgi:phosphoglycerate dehydrogenase-like enzyme